MSGLHLQSIASQIERKHVISAPSELHAISISESFVIISLVYGIIFSSQYFIEIGLGAGKSVDTEGAPLYHP